MEDILEHAANIQRAQLKMQKTVTVGINNLTELIAKAKDNITKDPLSMTHALKELQSAAQSSYDKEQRNGDSKDEGKDKEFFKVQRKFYASVNKFSKDIERRFKDDLSVISNPTAFASKDDLMRRALAIHFIRQGQFDLCDIFMDEAGINEENELRSKMAALKKEFLRMYSILDSLDRYQNVDSALEWARAHHEELEKLDSNLEFDLHRLQFIHLLRQQKRMEAVAYGQKYFQAFGDKHYTEIKRMMASIVYSHKLETSPYRSLCSPTLWANIRQEFQHDFCALLNMSSESPLYTSVLVGTTALPVILKLYKIVSATKTEWSQQDELPVELPLSDDLRYHSVFACPVSKEQASETNPPMMMPCGHVICKESLMSLSKSTNVRYGRNAPRFKCPYCPVELSVDQAIQVFF